MSITLLNILYLGPISGTCLDRANAFRRLGHNVNHINLRELLPNSLWIDRVLWHLGGLLFEPLILQRLFKKLANCRFDLCYVDGGDLVSPKVINLLRQYAPKVINYNIDDPLGSRDGLRFVAYRKSLPFYDLCVVMRQKNVNEAINLGANQVLRVFMSADEVMHAPRVLIEEDYKNWESEILFIGTWMPERGSFILALIQQGLPITIRGSGWQKSPEWSRLKPFWKGPAVYGDDYAKAIQCAKVNLGLLSKGNRDEHTTRSLEIPALGGFLCANRTSEHLEMYEEEVEAFFWDDAEECAAMCRLALSDNVKRQLIAKAGQKRLNENGHYNERVLNKILNAAGFNV